MIRMRKGTIDSDACSDELFVFYFVIDLVLV